MKRILILYRELAGYFVECLNHLCETYNVEAHVIAYPVHADAPFQFTLSRRVKLHSRTEYTAAQIQELVSQGNFDLLFVGGWFDKAYLRAMKDRKCPSLLGFDTQWHGTLRHMASALYGRLTFRPLFEYAFVPGKLQFAFAKKLGFPDEKIITGAYSCDVPKFSALAELRKKRSVNTRKLLFAGRYAPEKFIIPLCQLFSEMKSKETYNWELHCIGTGPLWNERPEGKSIIHHGFMQPSALFDFMKEGDAFVLPSTYEPWGVAVHEFAAAGFPMILSDAVGSSEIFLHEGQNGYLFKSGNIEDLKKKLHLLFSKTDIELETMGGKSTEYARQITPDTWAKSLYSIM